MPDIDEILQRVLKQITPGPDERARISKIAEDMRLKVSAAASSAGLDADVTIDGSVAKDTWLSGEADVDIFMRVSPELTREELETRRLEVARRAAGKYVERYAEHPYIETAVKGTKVNIVPCFKVEKGKWKSATDRTPFHTEYMKKRLDERLRSEVRLTKKFTKGIGVYGAEVKIKGFSGMLCEILTLNYGSFTELLEAVSGWERGEFIDVEKFYEGLESDIPDLFPEPLVVVDPVDKGRNVAAAVAEDKMWLLVAASRRFLQLPKLSFFYPPEVKALPTGRLTARLTRRGSDIIFIQFGRVGAVVDVLWSQLYKTENSLRNLLRANGFEVLRTASWSDEKRCNILMLEVERRAISPVFRHLGPPVSRPVESQRFLEKYLGSPETVSGPRIEDGRWVVQKKRRNVDARSLVGKSLRNGGKEIGVANKISKVLRKNFKILVNDEVAKLCKEHHDFRSFLTRYLIGRPSWLS